MKSYGPLSAEAYGLFFPEKKYEDSDFFEHFIREGNGPALELGCGDGRLLIPFNQKGLQVDGLDLSPHMLKRCEEKAKKAGVCPRLFLLAMQDVDFIERYKTLYIPFGSFMLISTMEDVRRALHGFYRALLPGGRLIIPLFIPTEKDIHQEAPTENTWRLRREGIREDGASIRCYEKASFDMKEQKEYGQYRYEVIKEGRVIDQEEEELHLRWHTQEQFSSLLKEAGFNTIQIFHEYTLHKASSKDAEFTFVGQR